MSPTRMQLYTTPSQSDKPPFRIVKKRTAKPFRTYVIRSIRETVFDAGIVFGITNKYCLNSKLFLRSSLIRSVHFSTTFDHTRINGCGFQRRENLTKEAPETNKSWE